MGAETDEQLRERLAQFLPTGGWHSAEELGEACGSQLDALAERYGTKRLNGLEMPSTTQVFWAIRGAHSDGEVVFEVRCFVAADGKRAVQVPGGPHYSSGYSLDIGRDIFATKKEALAQAFERAVKRVTDCEESLRNAKMRLTMCSAAVAPHTRDVP